MGKRARKYEAKIDGKIIGEKYEQTKRLAIEAEGKYFEEAVRIENQIKTLVENEPVLYVPYYIIFAKEIWSKQQKHKGLIILDEVLILEQKWESRGLNPIILEKIKEFYIQAYAKLRPFRLDISFLDGLHILS